MPLRGPVRGGTRSILAAVTRRTILLVEDEESISEPLARALERDGFEPIVQPTVRQAIEAFRNEAPDLVLLDLMLPDGDGRDVLREIRSASRVPVIMLTARGDELDRVLGLELGADDYVTKPFSAAELLARIRAVLRRTDESGPAEPTAALAVGDVRLDPATHVATQAGRRLELTAKEFDLLRALLGQAGQLVPRARLMEDVWQTSWLGSTKTLDVHISSLRKKLGDDPASPRYIHTIRGIGFRFAAARGARGLSLRGQLVLGAAYLLTAVVLALEIPLAINVERRAASELQAAALGRTSILAATIADPVAAGSRAPGDRRWYATRRRGPTSASSR